MENHKSFEVTTHGKLEFKKITTHENYHCNLQPMKVYNQLKQIKTQKN